MRTLDRYLLSEMIPPFLVGICVVIGMLLGNTLFALLNVIFKNNLWGFIPRLVIFNIPSLVVLTLPVGTALAAALAVNRWARESEITPVRMAGVPLRRIFLPIFCVGLFASLFSFWIGEHVVPRAQVEFQKTQSEMLGYAIAASPVLISDRVFTYQNYSFFVHEADKNVPGKPDALSVHGVMIYENAVDPDGFPRLITAKSAVYDNGLWVLSDVVVHQLDNDGFTRLEARAAHMTLDLRVPIPPVPGEGTGFAGQQEQYTMADLSRQIAVLARTGQDTTELEVAYQFKISLPFLCFAFALCAPPLSLRFARTGSFVGVFLSIVMVFVAWNTLLLTKALGLAGKMPPVLAAWTPDLVFIALGCYFLWRSE